MTKSDSDYVTDCSLYLRSVTVEDAGKYKVTARNDLGESNATISLNFDSEYLVELGGGEDDMPRWCCDGVCVELSFR